jgi:hypothetical protein
MRENQLTVSAASGSIFPDMFCNIYLVENHKIANNSATTETTEK